MRDVARGVSLRDDVMPAGIAFSSEQQKLMRAERGADVKEDITRWAYKPTGKRALKIDGESVMSFWWEPSVYEVFHRTQIVKSYDTVVLSYGAWNMGTNYAGVDKFQQRLIKVLKRTRAAMK